MTPLTVNFMSAFALNVPAVSVTVITGGVPLITAALALAPVAGDENTTLQPLQPSPAPLRVTINFPLDGTAVAGERDTVIMQAAVLFITFERVIVGARIPMLPFTIAGNVPAIDAQRITEAELVTPAAIEVDATCAAAGVRNPITVMVILAPPAIVLAVNVSVNTFDASDGTLMEAPDVTVTDGVVSDGEPVSVMRSLPLTGTAVAGVTTIVIETPVPPARTSDKVIAGPIMTPSTIAGNVPATLPP